MFDFEKLEVYKKARNFNRAIRSQVIRCTDLDGSTRSQLTPAGLSVMLNIAEGSGRFTNPDKKNFFTIARGSVFECVAIIDYLHDDKVIDLRLRADCYLMAEELSKMLYSMIMKLDAKRPA